ncbi:MAG: Flp family type IVb pilin [Desulfotomaculum sp.]|nr:Flp family type IVb pilin [Desulfotomaculum sp.]
MFKTLKRLWSEEEGQGMAEYGLILALVAVLLVGALVGLKDGLAGIFGDVQNTLNNPEGAGSSS